MTELNEIARLKKQVSDLNSEVLELKDIKQISDEIIQEYREQRKNHYTIIAHAILNFAKSKGMSIEKSIKLWNIKRIPHLKLSVLRNKIEEIEAL